MSEHSNSSDAPLPAASQTKAAWHPPTLEEIDYSATEAGGAGAVYDFVVYTGSA